MRFPLLLILILCSVVTASFADGPVVYTQVVHTQNGDVRGVVLDAAESFKRLPYAAPPVGDLRWKPPADPDNWNGVKDAKEFSFVCPQMQSIPIGDEDCLYLNVFRPKDAQGPLPVIVFIHGGHNATDSASWIHNGVNTYDASDFAKNGNVVVVTINYRLGALGFIAHPALSKESKGAGSGNYGYMDQLQALKWVHRNIAAFGGDPDNVTLMGASSGGGGITVLMTSPQSKGGLFHRAIIHSGQFRFQTLEQAEDTGRTFSQTLGCQPPHELRCMRYNRTWQDIVKAMPGGHDGGGSVNGPRHFLPVVYDGGFLPAPPLEIIRQGKHHHVPILIGNAVEETSWIYFADSKDIHTEHDYRKTIKDEYKPIADQVLRLYPANDFIELVPDYVEVEGALRLRPTIQPSPRKAYNAISADRWFVCPARSLLQALSVSQSEFVGRFLSTRTLPGTMGYLGASHGFDVVTVFGTFGYLGDPPVNTVTPTPDDLALTVKFQKTWADFARSGNPGDFWNRYDAAQDNYVMFNKPMSTGTHLRKAQCDYWYPDANAPYVELKDIKKPRVVNEGSLPPSALPKQ